MVLPQIWPVFNTINIILFDEKEKDSRKDDNKKLDNYTWYNELIIRHLRLSTYIFVAYFAYIFTFPYSIESISIFEILTYWLLIILLRDCLITYIFYGYWHWLLYESSYSKKMSVKKFNPEYPQQSQWTHDRFWTFSGTIISSFFEIFILVFLKQYSNNNNDNNVNVIINDFFAREGFWKYWINSTFWLLFIPYWRDFHFYWIHRMMHPWFSNQKNKFDIGRLLYKNVHSLHHKSYNTGPWSGLSMHPIEHIIYYSCVLLPLLLIYYFGLSQHCIHFLFNKFHATISPLPGHDGFDSPGGASYFHYLHHSHFQCNYGTPMVPFDRLFGTFEDGKRFRKEKKYNSAKEFIKHG